MENGNARNLCPPDRQLCVWSWRCWAFFQPDGYTDKQHCDFGSYLRLRIRPAAEALIQRDALYGTPIKIFKKDFNCPKGKEFI